MTKLVQSARLVELDVDVVSAAFRRLDRIFSAAYPVSLALSGDKDSLCLHDLVYRYVTAHPEVRRRLDVYFCDEEAIFPECEACVLFAREQWESIGVSFYWLALPFKHNNCFHSLEDAETWTCFDPKARECWVREPPDFAIKSHPIFQFPGQWNFQQALAILAKGRIRVAGVRANESLQRLSVIKLALAKDGGEFRLTPSRLQYPIWDWKDSDIWLYIKERGLPYPRCYERIYAINGKRKMRISQFFSIDTAGSLARMAEYYPGLWEKICQREPNAYLAALYFESEMFRRTSRSQASGTGGRDYKALCMDLFKSGNYAKATDVRSLLYYTVSYAGYMTPDLWRKLYNILSAGDPKSRSKRAFLASLKARLNM